MSTLHLGADERYIYAEDGTKLWWIYQGSNDRYFVASLSTESHAYPVGSMDNLPATGYATPQQALEAAQDEMDEVDENERRRHRAAVERGERAARPGVLAKRPLDDGRAVLVLGIQDALASGLSPRAVAERYGQPLHVVLTIQRERRR